MADEIMDVAGDTSTQEILEIGGSVTSDLFGEGDTDFFAITIEAGQTINVSQSNIAIPNLGREVTLQDSDGNVVASGPETFRFGTVDNLDFAFQAEETGTFFLSIESTDNFTAPTAEKEFGQGDYTISTTEIADDFGNFVSSATQLEAGNNEINGNLEYLGDADVFTAFLNAGDTISTNVETNVFTDRTLIGPDGNVLIGGPGQPSLANGFTVSEAGLYAVSIEASFEVNIDFRSPLDQTGEYNLQIDVEPGDSLPGDGTIEGTDGDDDLVGTSGNDAIFGNAGDDIIDSGAGNDYLVGGDGADVFVFNEGDGHDTIDGFEIGIDSLEISGVRIDQLSDISPLLSQDGQDVLIGLSADQSIRLLNTSLDDVLNGGTADNVITGTNGNDNLIGTDGVDIIDGGAGNDLLVGGEGDDVFVLAQGDGFNRISDFQAGEDVVNLTDFGFDDFGDVSLVENNNTIFVFLDENTSVELTGIETVDELYVDDFVL